MQPKLKMIPKMINNDKRNFYFLLIISFFACLALGWYSYHQYQIIETRTKQLAAITDTVRLYRTKTGGSGAGRTIFVGSKEDALEVLKTSDSKAYQAVKNTSGLRNYTDMKTVTRIDTVVKADTVYMIKDSTGKLSYSLVKDIQEPKKWYTAKVEVKNDSVGLKLSMHDRYQIISHDKSNGLFKPKSYVISVENENPYVTITDVKSFEIQPKNKHTAIKIGGVVAISAAAFLLLHK
ncbi:hypothetical protein [Mucilaginibacter ginsenosidivorax]|uniref:Uncharacterized protein n=1 Tax=Mucilaginibacter ginsenosidivorax TaxID=862126 RepID=A0A5B8W5D9_9SPHI|nr:hypothetical protein [Mucilaginibacter ginsenosidivorax]QEC78779.1 hypothetical protein FSB76_23545 [Mucilaginibacter ginsenosidivorax]